MSAVRVAQGWEGADEDCGAHEDDNAKGDDGCSDVTMHIDKRR